MKTRSTVEHSIATRFIAALFIAVLGITALAGCGIKTTQATTSAGTTQSGTTTVRLGLMANSDGAYLAAVAEDQGYFAKYGLQVKTSTFSAGINTVDAITLGQLDIGYVADFAALNRFGASEKSDLRIFAKISSSAATANKLYVAKDITALADLKGKGIVTQKGTVIEYWTAKLLQKAGLTASDVKLLPVSSPQEGIAIMESGQAVAYWGSGQTAQKLEASGKFKSLLTQADVASPTLSFAIANESYLKSNSAAAESYLKAMNEAVAFVQKDPEKAADIVLQRLNTPKETSLAQMKSITYDVSFKQDTVTALDSIYQWISENGLIKVKYDVRDYIDANALKTAISGAVDYK